MQMVYSGIRHCAALTTLFQQVPVAGTSPSPAVPPPPGLEPLNYPDILNLDPIIDMMCNFTALTRTLPTRDMLYEYVAVNPKGKLALSALVQLTTEYGNMIREGWHKVHHLLTPYGAVMTLHPRL